jgi:hypothetical protein
MAVSSDPRQPADPGQLAERLRRPLPPAEIPAAAAPAPRPLEVEVERGAERPASRPRRRASAAPSWGDVPFYVTALALAGGLWAVGGYFTLLALQGAGLAVQARLAWPWELSTPQLLAWLIPAGVSALELGFERRRGWGLLVFVGVAALDLVTTAIGLHAWGQARSLPLDTVIGLGLLGLVALALTFLPERIAGYCVRSIWAVLT